MANPRALTRGIVRSLLQDAGEPLAENSGIPGGPFEPETVNTVEGSKSRVVLQTMP
jgi:hypothetical protein